MRIKTLFKYALAFSIIFALGFYKINSAQGVESYYILDGEPYISTIDVGTFAPGVIQKINFYQGDEVKVGDVLMTIDNPLIRERYESIKNNKAEKSTGLISEYEEKIKNFEIKSPIDGFIFKILKTEKSFVRESDVVMVLIPKDSFRYSFRMTPSYKIIQPSELRSYFVPGSNLEIKLNNNDKYNGKIESIILEDDNGRKNSYVERYIISTNAKFDSISKVGDKIKILFPKSTITDRTSNLFSWLVDSTKNLQKSHLFN